jgi:hypothetical protein
METANRGKTAWQTDPSCELAIAKDIRSMRFHFRSDEGYLAQFIRHGKVVARISTLWHSHVPRPGGRNWFPAPLGYLGIMSISL